MPTVSVGFVQVLKINFTRGLDFQMTKQNSKSMFVGQEWADQTFIDLLENHSAQVTINADGYGEFPVAAGSVSVWTAK